MKCYINTGNKACTSLVFSRARVLFVVVLLSTCCSIVLADSFEYDLVSAAIERTRYTVKYDGVYRSIDYPGGDVPAGIGVCTDVLIRAYRAVGLDLQKEVHEDIAAHFDAYPSRRIWGLSKPDTNIDHRRVPNLQVFFERNGEKLPVTGNADDYRPGDIVTWMLAGNIPHIGIVTDQMSADGKRPLVVHNIGSGPSLEDMLFEFRITGHYRYAPGEHGSMSSHP
ncbi:MAG TPA: DUF1287 domain-containing protein [Gammaproteobacteria bacterium]|nr:DUF1287 domain-containing protein [Gammaproteobacteria bacterium]